MTPNIQDPVAARAHSELLAQIGGNQLDTGNHTTILGVVRWWPAVIALAQRPPWR